VDDLPRATDFYTRALPLTVGRRFGQFAVELTGGSSRIYLLEKPAGTHPLPGIDHRRSYERHWTPVHLDFVVPDIAAAVAQAREAGARMEGEVRKEIWGSIATLADPFGHGFCLLQFHGRGYDEIGDSHR
jgi:predicted enzyme related to lactoylglutathione lyase